MYLKTLFLGNFFSLTILLAQNSVGLNINSDDLEVETSIHLNSLSNYSDSTAYIIDATYLHTRSDNMTTIGISGVNTFQGMEGLALAFGAKSIFTSDFLAIPLFAKGTFTLPLNDTIPTTRLSTSFAYAPSVLTFRNGQSYSEFRIEADMEVISNIHIYTGYRNLDTEYTYYDKIFNSSFYGGLKLSF